MFLQFVYKPEILTSTNNSTKNQRTNKHTKKQRFVGGLQFTTNLGELGTKIRRLHLHECAHWVQRITFSS